ncbi:conserved hypothetical protein [Ricinus communis]|uniref:Uncharacterized protein n=1 Tax=Ricinus communis TaxID=3988 RepID=B9SYV3_RICCO|nr:conserved hypothetical protein [Ricinus communis]
MVVQIRSPLEPADVLWDFVVRRKWVRENGSCWRHNGALKEVVSQQIDSLILSTPPYLEARRRLGKRWCVGLLSPVFSVSGGCVFVS